MGVGLWGVLMGFPEEHTVFPLCLWGIGSRDPLDTKIPVAQVPCVKWVSICM